MYMGRYIRRYVRRYMSRYFSGLSWVTAECLSANSCEWERGAALERGRRLRAKSGLAIKPIIGSQSSNCGSIGQRLTRGLAKLLRFFFPLNPAFRPIRGVSQGGAQGGGGPLEGWGMADWGNGGR